MAFNFSESSVEFLKGVGPQRAETLKKELGIFTFDDLLHYFPFRYVDRSRFYTISEINEDQPYIQLKGTIKTITAQGDKRAVRLIALFGDETGTVELVWFQGIKWMRDKLRAGTKYIVFGKPTLFNNKYNIVHPEIEEYTEESVRNSGGLQGVYSTTDLARVKGIDSRAIARMQKTLVAALPKIYPETLSSKIITEEKLMALRDAFVNVHLPSDNNLLQRAVYRFKFEELFYIQLKLLLSRQIRMEKIKGLRFEKIGEHFNNFYHHHLPFELTAAQKRVLKEIRSDCGSGKQMNRLLQGDVGSGKTVVALLSMLMAIDNGFQCALMAPTEILASQHFETITSLLGDMNVPVALLTGSTRTAARNEILDRIADGTLKILIGTHALIEDDVQFRNEGLVVIDEQHRFGVQQRARLWMKKDEHPHVLVMTATPIPRTLAMTLYGDLDVSVIDQMPAGRKPVKTVHRYESQRLAVFGFMREQIALGRQIYIVYPLIDESEKLDLNNLMSGFESISRDFPAPQYRVSVVHGRMKAKDKEAEMQRFKNGQTQIMVATTVIEVGVNVPNASVMVIENAERFGLSQLHQLRGRVGRGADQSYCVLMTGDKLGNDSRKRMKIMCETTNGFDIAEMDLQMRGPGDLSGTQQSGVLNFRMADLAKDQAILEKARHVAIDLLKSDPELMLPENSIINAQLNDVKQDVNFSRVS
jgi:ATP-dependent DNA helicase RecG